jgi:hypothetical protein
VYLFQLMTLPKLFDNAAGLVEEILAVREDSFDLSRIRTLYVAAPTLVDVDRECSCICVF